MAIEFLSIFNGVTAIILILFGIICGFYFFFLYVKSEKELLPLVGVLFVGLGCFYLGPSTSFLNLLNGTNIQGNLYAYLSYTFTPIMMIVAMILGFNIFKQEWRYKTMWVLVPLAIVFWVFFFIFPEKFFESAEYSTTELMDISFIGIGVIINGIYILGSVGVLGVGFMVLARRIRGSPEYKKAVSLGICWALFGISGALDALLSEIFPIIIAPARAIMIAAYVLIFLGFKPSA